MLDPTLSDWLDRQADALDRGDADPAALLPRLAAAGVLGVAVEERLGGAGGTLADAVERVAAVAARSLTAAFVFWGQRAFIEYLLQSPNQELRQRLLGDLLAGRLAGATGLSNAMKFLSGIEALQVVAHAESAYCCSPSPSPAAPATTTPLARTAATRSGNWRWRTWPGAACRSRNTRPSVRQFSRKNRKPPSASPTPPYAVPPSEASSNGQEKAPRCGASSYSGLGGQPQDRRLITSVSSTSMFSRRGL